MSITNSQSSLRLTSIESVMPSSHLILCHPLLLLPPIPPSISAFSNELTLHVRWPKYWSFSFNIIPSKETPGLISFRMDWLHSNQLHNPRGIRTFLLMASRVSGLALIASAWIVYYFLRHVCHGLGPHTVFKHSYFMGNGGAVYSREKPHVLCPSPYQL